MCVRLFLVVFSGSFHLQVQASNALQSAVFNTWMVPLVLLWLESPFRLTLLTTGDGSPFRQSYTKELLPNVSLGVTTLCRLIGAVFML